MKEDKMAVLLIDMQPYFTRCLARKERKKIISAQRELLDWCAGKDIPVVVLEFNGFGDTIRILKKEFGKIPRCGTIVKERNDGFHGTELLDHLRALDVETLLLTGINAGACVKDTAKSAISHGFKIITCEKLISGSYYHREAEIVTWYKKKGEFHEDLETLIKTRKETKKKSRIKGFLKRFA